MHFEVLVEDQSGSIALEFILQKILGANNASHSWRVHSYQGLGRIPRDLQAAPDPRKRYLLDRLPSVLRGYGKSLGHSDAVIVIVDVDNRDCMAFKQDLLAVLQGVTPRPKALFRIAIEEGEAWLLGDRYAVKAAYPHAKDAVLNRYMQDAICGTWELLADAVQPGGAARLKRAGYPTTGREKCRWASRIARHMDVDKNVSKSFQVFRDGVRSLAGIC